KVPGHKEAGMVGTLTVSASAAVPTAAAGAAPSPTAAGAAAPTSASSGGTATAVTVDLEDIKFSTTAISIPANTDVTFTITNKGNSSHSFTIDALKVDTGLVDPGKTVTLHIK